MEKSNKHTTIKNETTNNETTKNETTNNETTKYYENKGGKVIEDQKEKSTAEENKKLDFGQEYGSSITESMTYRQYLSDSAWTLDNFNPITRVLPLRESMPDDESKKLIDGVVKGDMPEFLTKCRNISANCLDVGLEISNIAKILTQKRKEAIEKY